MRFVAKKSRLPADFPYAIRSFIGHLEGTRKSAHTIKNYRLDLESFRSFLSRELADRPVRLKDIQPGDLERFHEWLREQGLKNNTRRRKLLTVQKFLNYLTRRNKLPEGIARKVPTPHKIERVPQTVSSEKLLEAIRSLPTETLLDIRNRTLLWILAETGCLVSEVTRLRPSQFAAVPGGVFLELDGKSPRRIPVSGALHDSVRELRQKLSGSSEDDPWLFCGFNKFGSLGAPITSRGVELLVRHHSGKLGFPELTPRTFRHSAVVRWAGQGMQRNDIQSRLGLRTRYAFRVYDVLIRSSLETTSTS